MNELGFFNAIEFYHEFFFPFSLIFSVTLNNVKIGT